MRFFAITAFATSGLAALSLPSCAESCVGTSLTETGCNSIDVACICKNASWISNISCCVSTACDAADQTGTLQYAQQICSPVGVTNLPTSASCASTAAGTAASTGTAASVATSTAASLTSAAASLASSASSAASAASTASTAGAASQDQKMGLGMGIAAAAGLFAVAL